MSVSCYDPEFDQMRSDFSDRIANFLDDNETIGELLDGLFSIMNDYGAVSYT